ncbi:hypothetical protein RB195_018358 [Necator americanus]
MFYNYHLEHKGIDQVSKVLDFPKKPRRDILNKIICMHECAECSSLGSEGKSKCQVGVFILPNKSATDSSTRKDERLCWHWVVSIHR